jgi:hypothetical protein
VVAATKGGAKLHQSQQCIDLIKNILSLGFTKPYKPMKTQFIKGLAWMILVAVVTGCAVHHLYSRVPKPEQEEVVKQPEPIVEQIDPTSLRGVEAVVYVFKDTEYRHLLRYIVAQCQFESYGFSSRLYQKDRNFTGMGVAYKREQPRSGINKSGEHGRPTAIFASDYDCAMDLLAWYRQHEEFKKPMTLPEYTMELRKKAYFMCSVDHYQRGIERWMAGEKELAEWLYAPM